MFSFYCSSSAVFLLLLSVLHTLVYCTNGCPFFFYLFVKQFIQLSGKDEVCVSRIKKKIEKNKTKETKT